ncbi:Aspartyl/Asparaginyl beta-hydroxylase, partial [mine drainage metagenome]
VRALQPADVRLQQGALETGGGARAFAELDALKGHWQTIRAEALALAEAGHIRKAEGRNDASFDSFFRQGWKRYYLKWYGNALPSAQAQCPQTVALVNAIPTVKAAMFTLLPPGSKLNAHRDPFAGSLRYHLGLVTPNSPACRILVDGEELVWRDGEDFMFDETFVHWAENRTEHTRVILFCDIERPLYTPVMRAINRAVSRFMGQATATDNVPGEPVGDQPSVCAPEPLQQHAGQLEAALAAQLPCGEIFADPGRAGADFLR